MVQSPAAAPESDVITGWSPGAEAMFGYRAADILGRPASLLIPDDRLRLDIGVTIAARGGSGVDLYRTQRVRSDGTRVDVVLTVAPVSDGHGAVTAIVSVARPPRTGAGSRDVLELELERERAAATHLRQMDRLKEEFVATVSHELRTPVASILGFVEVLLGQAGVDDAVRAELLRRVARNATAMSMMIDQLLDYSRIEAGAARLVAKPMRLSRATARCLDSLRDVLHTHDIRVSVPDDVCVSADEHAFERVLGNLLTNAAKFSPRDTTIDVEARTRDVDVVVAVTDRGAGIPTEELPHLFARFFRGSAAAGTHGTGIGLSIVQRYVEMMGGRVWVESREGSGSTFSFSLPPGRCPEA